MTAASSSAVILTSLFGRRLGFSGGYRRLLCQPLNYEGFGPMGVGYAMVAQAASANVTNTTTETEFDNFITIPANTLEVGSLIKVRFQGIVTNQNSTDTLVIKLYIGGKTGTSLIATSAQDVGTNDVFQGEYEIAVRTIGSSGTIVGVGTYKSIPAAEGTMTIKDDILASTTLDTTAAQKLSVTATWSVASPSNVVRVDFMRAIVY